MSYKSPFLSIYATCHFPSKSFSVESIVLISKNDAFAYFPSCLSLLESIVLLNKSDLEQYYDTLFFNKFNSAYNQLPRSHRILHCILS